MKTSSAILAAALTGSILLNFYFIGRNPSHTALTAKTVAPITNISGPRLETHSAPRFDWREVESSDYRKYIANLRSLGVPEQTIHDIIVADVSELFKFRWRQHVETNKAASRLTIGQQARQQMKTLLVDAAKQHHSEKQALLKELLGRDFVLEESPFAVNNSDVERAMLNFLPAEKREETFAVLRDYDARWERDIKNFFGKGPIRDEDREPYLAFKHTKDHAVAAVLAPEEKEQYDLRFSQLAGHLQYKFQGLPLSEEAFVELYRYAKKHDDILDFYLLNPGENYQKAFRTAEMDVFKKASELAANPNPNQLVPREIAQRFGF
jgi:hypothetical protein